MSNCYSIRNIPIIDSHIHLDTRPYENYEKLSLTVNGAITLAHDPMEPISIDILKGHFKDIITDTLNKAHKNNLNLFICLGIHPRMIPDNNINSIDIDNLLINYLNNKFVVGIGEIGLEKASKKEIEIFEKQLILAKKLNLPAVVHTPRTNKLEITKIILETINSLNLNYNNKIIIEHCNKEIIPLIIDHNFNIGLTVQPSKLTPLDVVDIVKKYENGKFLLNSDSSSSPSDILSVPKTVLKLKINNIENNVIKKVCYENSKKLFNLNI